MCFGSNIFFRCKKPASNLVHLVLSCFIRLKWVNAQPSGLNLCRSKQRNGRGRIKVNFSICLAPALMKLSLLNHKDSNSFSEWLSGCCTNHSWLLGCSWSMWYFSCRVSLMFLCPAEKKRVSHLLLNYTSDIYWGGFMGLSARSLGLQTIISSATSELSGII